MELSFQTRPLRCLGHILHEMRAQEETAEVIVPDSCPDVERIVYSAASVVLRGHECRAGCITVSGGIRASALCMPEGASTPRALDAYLPFSLRIDHPAAAERLPLILSAQVRQVDARLVNSRKVLFRVEVGCTADAYAPQEHTLYTLENAPQALAVQTQTYPVLLPAETAERSFSVSDEPELPGGRPFAAEICSYDTCVRVTDSKVVGSKAVFKGHICLHVLYLSGDGSINAWEEQIPFSQYCALSDDYSEAPLSVTMLVTSAELELDGTGEGRRFLLSVGLTAQCVVSRTIPLTLIEDAYAVGGTLEAEWKQYSLACELDRQTIYEELRTQSAEQADCVIDCAAYCDFPYTERTDGVLRVKAPVCVHVLYRDAAGALQGACIKTESACETALCEQARCIPAVSCCTCFAQPNAGGMEIRAETAFGLTCTAAQELRTLCGGTLSFPSEKDPERPSVILRACRAEERVWDVAKRYGTTCAALCEANGLQTQELHAGQMLLIPMCAPGGISGGSST